MKEGLQLIQLRFAVQRRGGEREPSRSRLCGSYTRFISVHGKMENGYIHIMVSNGDNYEDEQWVALGDPIRKK